MDGKMRLKHDEVEQNLYCLNVLTTYYFICYIRSYEEIFMVVRKFITSSVGQLKLPDDK